MNLNRSMITAALIVVASTLAGQAFAARGYTGQVNISGATLFKAFFGAPAATDDWIDVNGNGIFGFDFSRTPVVDQLALTWVKTGDWNPYWCVQYRAVGSGMGLNDLVNYYQIAPNTLDPNLFSFPTDDSYINTVKFGTATGINTNGDATHPGGCPEIPNNIDIGVMDVPTTWFITDLDSASAAWDKTPLSPGYGANNLKSSDVSSQNNLLQTLTPRSGHALNINTSNPDQYTIYDSPIAWVPIALAANPGTGIANGNVTQAQMQFLFVTGRMPTGENLVAATRDSASGTRNAAMNSLGIDPSFGSGDNVAKRSAVSGIEKLGPIHQPSNLDSTGMVRSVLRNRRLAVGYLGVDSAQVDIKLDGTGWYDVLNLQKTAATGYVRPNLNSILHNSNINTGWQVGGNETMATVGDPNFHNAGTTPQMYNVHGAKYLSNLLESIRAFNKDSVSPIGYAMPGEYMAVSYVLTTGLDAVPQITDPTAFVTNAQKLAGVQDYIAVNNTKFNTPAYGIGAGLAPQRVLLTAPAKYSDGTDGSYYVDSTGAHITSSNQLNVRNKIMGDFNNNGTRDSSDIAKLMQAIYSPRTFEVAASAICVEIIGDFTGDGSFDASDVRYFADGLAVNAGKVDRSAAFAAVDNAWTSGYADANHPAGNYFKTTLATGDAYQANSGWSKADIAGSGSVTPGANLRAVDGKIDSKDIDQVAYVLRGGIKAAALALTLPVSTTVHRNSWNWTNIDDAVFMDLSCDMNGDMKVDSNDVDVIVHDILGTEYGDVNLDGYVNALDGQIIKTNISAAYGKTWAQGDVNGDGYVTVEDQRIFNAAFLTTFASHWLDDNCASSNNCDGMDMKVNGKVDFEDFAVLAQGW